jgi:Bacterial TniB protein
MLTHQACQLMTDLSTSLVIVDEVHGIDRSRASHAQQSDQLKYFMDHVPATFVVAGINVENCGFFNGHRGEQLARRFTTLKVSPSNYSTIPQRQEWALLIEGFERALRLHAHKSGSLLPLADYLYGRTGGYIVSLSHLIREAAIMAILSGRAYGQNGASMAEVPSACCRLDANRRARMRLGLDDMMAVTGQSVPSHGTCRVPAIRSHSPSVARPVRASPSSRHALAVIL